jgi:hypothetical protein
MYPEVVLTAKPRISCVHRCFNAASGSDEGGAKVDGEIVAEPHLATDVGKDRHVADSAADVGNEIEAKPFPLLLTNRQLRCQLTITPAHFELIVPSLPKVVLKPLMEESLRFFCQR